MSGSQNLVLKASGISTHPNPLSSTPAGSMSEALNVIIDRAEVVEPRRGFSQYGDTFGNIGDLAKQLINYKDVILRHVLTRMEFDADAAGDFRTITASTGFVQEVEDGLRIKSIEANGNLYMATFDGIKKISARNRLDLLTAPLEDAGGAKGLDVNVMLNFTQLGFLEPNSKCAYRILFVKKDLNENLIVGAPTASAIAYNPTTSSCYVDVNFSLPSDITTSHSYQLYRTGLSISDDPLVEPGDPGDEMNLVFEESITSSDITNGFINVSDVTPEDFRRTGTLLYTNPVSGEGILQANEKPPFAKDISLYKNYTFYANTSSVQRLTFSILTIDGIDSNVDTITVSDNNGTDTIYTFQGDFETFTATYGTLSTDLFNMTTPATAKNFTISSANIERKYYVWYSSSDNDQDPAISGYIGIKVLINQTKDETVTATSTGTNLTFAAPADFTVKIGDMVKFGSEVRTIATVTNQTTFTINSAFLPDLSANTVTVTSVDDVSDIRIKTADTIMDSTDDFNAEPSTVSPEVFISCANNGYVTVTPSYVTPFVPAENIANFTIAGNGDGIGEDLDNNKVFLPRIPIDAENGPTVSQQLEQVAKSLMRVINAQDTLVAGYYQSTYLSVPGQMLLEGRDTTGPLFYLFSTVGTNFTPTIPVDISATNQVFSTNEVRPNRIMFSKLQQPDAVPIVNYIDVGPKDREIKRIIALRDSLFILKEDGIYRLSGDIAPFTVTPFDFSVQVLAPDTAVVLNNQIYALSTQGVIVITDTGVSVISRPIENLLLNITRDGFDYKTISFGVSYESDRAYHLWVPTFETDTTATQCFRFNTFTNSWTRWNLNTTCGIVNFGDNKMYLGSGDRNGIEKERKSLTRDDYADRQFDKDILIDGVYSTGMIDLDNIDDVHIGDVLIQRQYVTINQFNRLLKKLDDDIFITDNDYLSTLQLNPGRTIRNALVNLANKLDADPDLSFTNYLTLINNYSNTITSIVPQSSTTIINISGTNNFKVGRYVKFADINTFPVLGSVYRITAVGLNSITIDAVINSVSTPGASPTVTTAIESSQDAQGCYNLLTGNLNLDPETNFLNYPTITGYVDFEINIDAIDKILNRITVSENQNFLAAPAIVYNAIQSRIIYNPQFFGDPSVDKQVREGTALFENSNFSTFIMGYASDKHPSFEDIVFERPGIGDFGQFVMSNVNFGGVAAPIPLRTYVPLQKQRCRFLNVKLEHKVAFEKYSLFGISLTFRPYNIRSNR